MKSGNRRRRSRLGKIQTAVLGRLPPALTPVAGNHLDLGLHHLEGETVIAANKAANLPGVLARQGLLGQAGKQLHRAGYRRQQQEDGHAMAEPIGPNRHHMAGRLSWVGY